MALCVLIPVIVAGSMDLVYITHNQTGFFTEWYVFRNPFTFAAFWTYFCCATAQCKRAPFDLAEAESELVAGFHTEYSSMKFAAFFMAEYANMITVASMTTVLFLGGWQPLFPVGLGSNFIAPGLLATTGAICLYHGLHPARRLDRYTLPVFAVLFFALAAVLLVPGVVSIFMPLFWFVAKTGFLLFVFIWIRGTLPRFRYDQLMGFAWKFLFPAAVLNLLATALMVALFS